LSIIEWKTIAIHLMNHAIYSLNRGNTHLIEDYLQLIEYLLSKDYLLHNNRLDYGRYRNIILVYLIGSSNNFKKTSAFIDTYSSFLAHPHPHAVKAIHLVYVLLLEGNHKKAEDDLRLIAYGQLIDPHLRVFYKKIELMIFYLKGKQTILGFESSLKNFRTFISNQYPPRGKTKDIQKTKQDICLTFARLIKKLYSGNLKNSDLEKEVIAITDKIWLQNQI